jgi:predicted permease
MEHFFKDIRYGIRILLKSPGFTAVAVISLALGIGANTVIFSFLSRLTFSPLPVSTPTDLVSVFTTDVRNPGPLPTSHLNYIDYRDHNDSFSGLLAYSFAAVSFSPTGGESKQLIGLVVSGNYFDVLGVRPLHGRTFLPDEDRTPGTHPVAVLSFACWQRDFGGDTGVVGSTITFNRHQFTVVGITPREFSGTNVGFNPDFWVPMMMHAQAQPGFSFYNERRAIFLNLIGRLKPGISIEQAQTNLGAIANNLERDYRTENEGRNIRLVPLLEARRDPDGDGSLMLISWSLIGVVATVLIIACANVTNLLLARATRRRKEIAVRIAIGAGRGRLIRQLLTESILLSLLGGGIGLILALWTKDLIPSFFRFGNNNLPDKGFDLRILGFTFIVSLASGLLFGLAPALQASRSDLVTSLKGDVAAVAGRRRFGFSLRKTLVVLQVALSLFALVTAGLFVRSLQHAQSENPGFIAENILLMGFDLGREGYSEGQGEAFHRQLVERARSVPGVLAVTIARDRPFGGGFSRSVFIEGKEPPPGGRGVLVQTNYIGENFFETLGIQLIRGREFTQGDNNNAPEVVIINETMANQFWQDEDPIGKRFKFFGDQSYRQVVGIARDSKYNSLVEDRRPFVYLPFAQEYDPQVNLYIRAANDVGQLSTALRNEVQVIDPSITALNVETLEDRIAQSLTGQRMQAGLLTIFGLLALLLASVGLYGVMSYSVAQSTREIGIRMALGAEHRDVLSLVLRQGALLVAIGLALGMVVALMVTRAMESLFFRIGSMDPVAFGVTSLILLAVALLASYIPARRATKIDPTIALKYE